jgi:hypothetical protein
MAVVMAVVVAVVNMVCSEVVVTSLVDEEVWVTVSVVVDVAVIVTGGRVVTLPLQPINPAAVRETSNMAARAQEIIPLLCMHPP